MIRKYYKCEFFSDIVLPASANTQGNISLNDFIPGNNFLGIVAANGGYDSFSDDAFEVFHSGSVQFCDAHLLCDNQKTFKIPLSFHNIKTKTDEIFNRLHLNDEEEKNLRIEQKQLKQIRNGFMTDNEKFIIPEYTYAQKSSYDKSMRKSKESGMFGYSALKSGSEWIFHIDYEDEKFIQKVEERLLGDKKLGKSKTAQYGQVHISATDTPREIEHFIPNDGYTYIYVNSRVTLFEADGTFSTTPSIENLGLSSGEIAWDKTYIKTSTYTPYNYQRQTKEYTRVCINKGSIITLKDCTEQLPSKLGAFLNEGFGEIIVNPRFLESKQPALEKVSISYNTKTTTDNIDNNLLSFLEQKEQKEQDKFAVASHVQEVYKNLIGPSKSQWGEIRSFASTAENKDELINKIEEYISKGKSKEQWKDKKSTLLKEINKSEENALEFTKLLAMIVSKHTKGACNGQ